MNESFTLPITEKKHQSVGNCANESQISPSPKAINFLKLFARNYQVEGDLPEGLQEFILG